MNDERINTVDSMKVDESNESKELLTFKEVKKMQQTFLDNMSHELRTPITVILGYAGILYEEIEDADLKEMAEIILKSSNRLTESLNLLLDQSEIDTNRLHVDLERTNLVDILFEIANIYRPVVEDKNLQFLYSYEVNEAFCNIDVKMFNKIMTNLMTNAIKFTEKGSIEIHLKEIVIDSIKYVNVEITDSGIGISEEKHSVIFEAFRQVSEGMNRLYQGTGLGLSITKKFTELMDGNIFVTSELDKGTTFTLQFPQN